MCCEGRLGLASMPTDSPTLQIRSRRRLSDLMSYPRSRLLYLDVRQPSSTHQQQ